MSASDVKFIFDQIAADFPFCSRTGLYSYCVFLCPECSDFSPPVTMMLMIFLCMEALLFLTFTAVMFCTQLHSICNDETVSA